VSIPSDPFERLIDIERLLAQTKSSMVSNRTGADPVALHLAEVPSARIRELTSMLQQRAVEGIDEIDALAMRLLLNDYSAAVAHLRAVAREAAALIDGAAAPVKDSQRFLRIDHRRKLKRESRGSDDESPGEGEQTAR
jgi:hypothetical protein